MSEKVEEVRRLVAQRLKEIEELCKVLKELADALGTHPLTAYVVGAEGYCEALARALKDLLEAKSR